MENDLKKMNVFFESLISNSYDSVGEIAKKMKPENISKIIYEELVDSDLGNLKIFFYTEGKSRNNKPYKLGKKITFETFCMIMEQKKILQQSKVVVADDIFKMFAVIAPVEADAVVVVPEKIALSIAEPVSGEAWESQMGEGA